MSREKLFPIGAQTGRQTIQVAALSLIRAPRRRLGRLEFGNTAFVQTVSIRAWEQQRGTKKKKRLGKSPAEKLPCNLVSYSTGVRIPCTSYWATHNGVPEPDSLGGWAKQSLRLREFWDSPERSHSQIQIASTWRPGAPFNALTECHALRHFTAGPCWSLDMGNCAWNRPSSFNYHLIVFG